MSIILTFSTLLQRENNDNSLSAHFSKFNDFILSQPSIFNVVNLGLFINSNVVNDAGKCIV